ncbi:MAG TPA: hypothetical protein VFF78_03020 [Anaerolineaceae bacterium]|nr:hypothetical protein [Anaerolineaceae bacterium]
MDYSLLTQKNLDNYKAMFPDDQRLQTVTLAELIEHSKTREASGVHLQFAEPAGMAGEGMLGEISPCAMAIGGLVIDCIFVLTGAIYLAGKIPPSGIARVAQAAEPAIPEIERTAAIIASDTASATDKAMAIVNVGRIIYSVDALGAVLRAITDNLTWWDAALFGVTALATLVAVFATEGVAAAAAIVIEMAMIGFVISDAFKVADACQ